MSFGTKSTAKAPSMSPARSTRPSRVRRTFSTFSEWTTWSRAIGTQATPCAISTLLLRLSHVLAFRASYVAREEKEEEGLELEFREEEEEEEEESSFRG